MASNPIIPDLVSVIIPVHNRARLLREAVRSVLDQTYRPIEIIIVDDGSTDDTPHMIASMVSENRSCVRSLRIENGGPGLAREAGRELACGEFVQYLDSDDLLLPTKFELQVSALRASPECDVAYGKTAYVGYDQEEQYVAWKRTGEKIDFMFPSFLVSRWWGTSTPLYRRSITDRVGSWLSLRNEEDWEYDCRVAKEGGRLRYCDAFVSVERDHSGDRLSRNGASDASKLRDRAEAHRLILSHANSVGTEIESTEMRTFVRELFLLSRQCGAVGLTTESRMLLREAYSVALSGDKFQLSVYYFLSSIFGWTKMGRFANFLDNLRS